MSARRVKPPPPGGRNSWAMPEDLVPFADQLARPIKELRCENARLTRQPVTLSMGYQRQIASLQLAAFSSLELKPNLRLAISGEHES
jgi:hypothetical protein